MSTADRSGPAPDHWSRRTSHEVAVVAWALVLSALMLGPALDVGYVLTYDMVWVPDLAVRPDFFGIASGLPRAVPSDAVVAVLDEVVPGMLLQKLVLLLALAGAGVGAARLLAERILTVRLFVVSFAVWSPFVVERLVLGAWPVLLGYAALPWVVDAARTWRGTARFPRRLLWLVPLGCLSPSAGLATALTLVALAAGRSRWRSALALLTAANAPWVVSGLLHSASATSDALGAEVFALRGEGSVPGPLAALTLGGVWNTEVVPDSRTGALGWVALALVVVLSVIGLHGRQWVHDRCEGSALLACWTLGWGLAVLTWAAPGAVGAVAAQVPGAGLIRDGARMLVLCLPLLVLLVGEGAAAAVRRFPPQPVARLALAFGLVLLPVALLPDAAGGAAGAVGAATYPAAYEQARPVVAEEHARSGGDVLVLPPSSYRQPSWNGDRKVLDPLGRYLTPDYVASDVLVVADVTLAGEDPRFGEVSRALELPDAAARARALAAEGIGIVVIDREASGTTPTIAGDTLMYTPEILVVSLSAAADVRIPTSWLVLMSLAWTAYVVPLAASASVLVRTLTKVFRVQM